MLWDGAEIYDCDNYGIHLNLYVPDHPTNYTRNNVIRNCRIHDIHPNTIAAHGKAAYGILVGCGQRGSQSDFITM